MDGTAGGLVLRGEQRLDLLIGLVHGTETAGFVLGLAAHAQGRFGEALFLLAGLGGGIHDDLRGPMGGSLPADILQEDPKRRGRRTWSHANKATSAMSAASMSRRSPSPTCICATSSAKSRRWSCPPSVSGTSAAIRRLHNTSSIPRSRRCAATDSSRRSSSIL